ncbi:M10 family metallopeptidase C-terminal domain-containing protein [Sinorhizobium sp. BG8]|uniref:M10 family metallopeptidase C-terminal domain-containing protein n=1 Tax=Sinorhizobium sp. BG8 TaxID=2613773 RepID=UPI00193CCC83|nr:M10 family metallopeptidase C-terminal domain-containing protein [Sinorhizobium sp. BG8]
MLNWNRIAKKADFDSYAFDLLVLLEGSTSRAYLDTASSPAPTIGIGFNLRYNLEPVLRAMVGDDHWNKTLQDQLKAVIDRSYSQGQSSLLNSRLDAVMKAWNESRDSSVPDTFSFSSSAEISDALTAISPSYYATIDRWLSGIPQSRERAVLFSMAYNAPSLLGPKLKAAIEDGSRAEAWYEIRYNSNGSGISGIANRRYVEAEHFRLFDKDSTATTAEALSAGRMYTAHRDKILSYETKYDADNAGRIKGLESIDPIYKEYAPAIARLVAAYKVPASYKPEELQVGATTAITLKGDGSAYDTAANDADFLIGSTRADALYGGVGSDVLVGNSGNDRLFGQSGKDWLYGGSGADRLSGGTGADVFVFKSVAEIGRLAGKRDVILDFVSGEDRIDLSAIDANGSLAGDQFTFLRTKGTEFHDKAGELRWLYATREGTKVTLIEGDVDGDGIADFRLELTGRVSLEKGDFLL